MTKVIRKKEKKPFPFKIGADPEFNILIQNQRVSAIKLITALFNKEYKENGLGFDIPNYGQLGWDAVNSTGELRPRASKTPSKVIKSIRNLVKTFTNKSGLFELSTKCEKAPIGGHIHFELNQDQKTNYDSFGNKQSDSLMKKFAIFYLPVMLGEDTINLRIRLRGNYGELNDYRIQNIKNTKTLEFRTPTAEWLTTPEIAEATIAYLATVYNQIVNHPKTIENYKQIFLQSHKQTKALQELTLTHYIPLTKIIMQKIRKAIKEFEFYPHYKEEIELILNPEKILAIKKKANYDIVQGWGFANKNMPTKRELLTEKSVKTAAMKTNLDVLMPLVRMPYNDDTNVSSFVKEIQKRVIAFNWKLKYHYFLFGLKPGIEDYFIFNANKHILYGRHQLKTLSDADCIAETIDRMTNRFLAIQLGSSPNSETKNKYFIIGIPYKIRIDLKTKPLIEFVYEIEKGYSQKPKDMYGMDLAPDSNLPDNQRGKIWQVYNRPDQGQEIADSIMPSDPVAVSNARQARIEEENQDEPLHLVLNPNRIL